MKWLKIIRPHTLPASVCPVLVALAVTEAYSTQAVFDGKHLLIGVVTLVCAMALQILSNLVNDYYDFVRGADKKGRAGFSRALSEGTVTLREMRCACLVALGVSVALGAYLVWEGGWVILLIGVLSILFAWLYTATSHSLSYLGIADVFVLLFYGIVAGFGTAWLQLGAVLYGAEREVLAGVLLATAANGLISMNVLMLNNLRDMDDDRAVGKRTFPVRFGKRAGEIAMGVTNVLVPVCAYLALRSVVVLLVIVPLVYVYVRALKAEGRAYNTCLMLTGVANVIYTALVLIVGALG